MVSIEEIIKRTSHIPSSVYEPEQRMWYEHISPITKKIVIVDFGTGWGKSASTLGLCNPRATVFTFDIGTPHINTDRSKEEYVAEVLEYIRKSGATNVFFQLKSSLEVEWKGEIDILNIDSDHTYETTKKELNKWLPFLTKGGYLFLHDWEHPRCPGVREAFDELVPFEFKLEFRKATQSGEVKCAYFIKK